MKTKIINKILIDSFLMLALCISGFWCGDALAASGTYSWYGVLYKYDGDTLTISAPDPNYSSVREISPEVPFAANNKNDVKKIIVEDGVKSIEANSFKDYVNLEELVLPKTMPGQISDYAFSGAPKLKNVTIPDGLIRIGNYAFYGTGITKVEIPIYTDWLGEHAFNDDTQIIMLKEQTGIIAAGTAGPSKGHFPDSTIRGEGYPYNDTCYNRAYIGGGYYDDTAFWRLHNDGTLVVWGTELISGYSQSRVPWGCYKDKIKKMVFNDDKTGKLTKRNKVNRSELLPNAKYAIYVSKPVDEIMANRIKVISGPQTWDCRYQCKQGFKNVESMVFNRGIETIRGGGTFYNQEGGESLKDVYISKYIKNVDATGYWYYWRLSEHDGSSDYIRPNLHLGVSLGDYRNNGYTYTGDNGSLVNDNGFKELAGTDSATYNYNDGQITEYKVYASVASEADEYYVPINDTSAPDTITYNGKTLYKYETYITKADGSVDVSLPNMEDVEYYAKEIEAPEGFQLDPTVYKVDMSGKIIDIQVADYPVGYKEADPKQANSEKNPNTATSIPVVYFVMFGALSSVVGLIVYKRIR